MVQLRSSQVTQATLAEEVEMFIEIFLPGLSVRLIAQHVQVGDGELHPGLYVLHGELARPKSVSDTKTKIPLVLKMF